MRFLTAFAFIALISAPAFAQNNDMRAVMSRMDQLQRQMDTVSRQVYKGENPPAGAVSNPLPAENSGLAAAMDERMNNLEGSLRQITNRLDEQDYAVNQMKQQFELFKSDMEMRLKEMGTQNSAALAPAPSAPQQSAADSVTADTTAAAATTPASGADDGRVRDLPNDSAAGLYDAAFQALREQKYDRAESAFKDFLKRYNSDALAGNAQYWLGETYYVRGNYQEAAKVFAQGYQKYPKSSKAPDNLLKLGLSLSQNNKKQEACLTLQQLGVQYTNAAAVIKQRAEDERKKLNCAGATG